VTGLERRAFLGALGAVGAAALSGCAFTREAVYLPPAPTGTVPVTAQPTAALPPAVTPQVDGPLVYFNWADFMDPAIFEGFSEEYGVEVIQSAFDSMESLRAKMGAGNRYDVVFPTGKTAERLLQAGQLQRIDPMQLPAFAPIPEAYPFFASPWYDPTMQYTAPNTMYKTGICYRTDKVTTMTGTWRDMWNEQAKGRIFNLDDQDEVLGFAALMLGIDVNTGDPAELQEIVDLLLTQTPYLRGFSSADVDNMLSGKAWVQQMWSGDVISLLASAEDPSAYSFVTCTDGVPVGNDTFAVPANAEHPGTALLFIDYCLRPENAKLNVKYLGYPTPVPGTEKTYARLVRDMPSAVVTAEELSSGVTFRNVSPAAARARDRAWTMVKSG
jgi:spermidine/putrescine transport system substrate-binding protein